MESDEHSRPPMVPGDLPTLVGILDDAKLDARYWRVFAILAFAYALDYFDFFIIGFLVSEVGPAWSLTYGQVAAILLGGGVGSIAGALIGGQLGDRFGRRPVLIASNLICGVASGMIALVPHGGWILFAFLRLVAGVALGAIAAVALAYVIERTPGRYRRIVVGLNMVAPSAGIALASSIAGLLIDQLGWRGVAAIGALPVVAAILIFFFVDESVQWLVARERHDDALAVAEKQLGRPITAVLPPPVAWAKSRVRFSELLSDPHRFWLAFTLGVGVSTGVYGTYLWGPAILTMTQSITTGAAARLFLFASIGGISGKIVFAIVPHFLGRRATAIFCTALGGLSLAMVALMPSGVAGGFPLIMLCFIGMAFFLEGGLANILPYAAEIFPVRLAARGAGLVQGGVGVGKILGPLSLTVIAGSSDIIRPAATAEAVPMAFLFLALCAGGALLALLLIRIKERA